MKIRLEFYDVNSAEEDSMATLIINVIDSILKDDKVEPCLRMICDIYEDYKELLNCTNKKKFQDIIKLLLKLDEKENDV